MRSVIWLLAAAGALSLFASAAQVAQGAAPAGAGSFLLTANSPGGTYAPTFTGNGMLGVRVPPSGQGYAGGTVPAQSELAGFYGQVSNDPKPANDVQQRANIPTWSTLTFGENGNTFTVPGAGVSGWRQSIDLHTGIVTTTASWTAPDGHVTDLSYEVLTDRANPNVGLVRLQFTPHWSGTATVSDAIDGTADTTATPELTTQVAKGWNVAARQDWVTIATQGTGIQATLASQLQVSPNVLATTTQTDQTTDQSVGQELGFPVQSGQTYTITKYVGVESSQTNANSLTAAQAQAGRRGRHRLGFAAQGQRRPGRAQFTERDSQHNRLGHPGREDVFFLSSLQGLIMEANLDGTGLQTIVSGLNDPVGIAADPPIGKVYWTGGGVTQSANLDGSGVQTLLTVGSGRDIEINTSTGTMYIGGNSGIHSASPSGSNLQLLATTDLQFSQMSADFTAGKIYWDDISTETMYRVNLGGIRTHPSSWHRDS